MSESVLPACWSGGSDPPAPRPGASAPCDRGCCTSARRSVRGSSGARVGPVPPVAVRCPAPRRSAGTEDRRRLGMLPRRPCPRIPVRGPPPAAPGGDGPRSFAAGCGPRRWGTPRGPRPQPTVLRRMCRGARVRRRGTSAPDVVPRGAPPPIGGKGVGKGPPPAAPGWGGTLAVGHGPGQWRTPRGPRPPPSGLRPAARCEAREIGGAPPLVAEGAAAGRLDIAVGPGAGVPSAGGVELGARSAGARVGASAWRTAGAGAGRGRRGSLRRCAVPVSQAVEDAAGTAASTGGDPPVRGAGRRPRQPCSPPARAAGS